MPDIFATPDDLGPIRASELHSSLGESLGAQFAETLDPQSGVSAMQLFRRVRSAVAGGAVVGGLDPTGMTPEALQETQDTLAGVQQSIPDVPIADAKARVKQEGLEGQLPLPDQPSIKEPVLHLMIQEAHEHADRQAAIARGPSGFIPGALGLVTTLGAGIIDPVNAAAFSIPVLGEARWGKLLADAGEGLFARAGARAVQGMAQGAVGGAALTPADWWFHTLDGRDYTMADALKSVVMSAGMGGVAHALHGGYSDLRAKAKGLPLPGSIEDQLAAALERPAPTDAAPAGIATGEGVPGIGGEPINAPAAVSEARPGAPTVAEAAQREIYGPGEELLRPEDFPPGHPARILADLPPQAQEDVVRVSIANAIADRPNNAAEMLTEAAKADRRIAESLTPHAAAAGASGVPDPVLDPIVKKAADLGSPMDIALRWSKDPDEVHATIDSLIADVKRAEKHLKEKYGVKKVEDLEDAPLTKTERDFLFYGDAPTGVEQLREIERQLQPVGSLDEAAQEIAYELKRLPDAGRPLSSSDQLVLARLQVLFSEVEHHGGNLGDVIKEAGAKYAARFGDPNDAHFMATDAAERLRALFAEQPRHAAALPDLTGAQRPDWQQFADARPAYEDPQAVEESKAAAATPEPASVDPVKAPTEAERLAKDADQLLADMKPQLTEAEWASLEESLNKVQDDKAAYEQIARDGAACLAAAGAA